jgi:hypothetical protein
MGLLGEILMRTYYESQKKKTYLVRDLVNFEDTDRASPPMLRAPPPPVPRRAAGQD